MVKNNTQVFTVGEKTYTLIDYYYGVVPYGWIDLEGGYHYVEDEEHRLFADKEIKERFPDEYNDFYGEYHWDGLLLDKGYVKISRHNVFFLPNRDTQKPTKQQIRTMEDLSTQFSDEQRVGCSFQLMYVLGIG